MRSLISMTLFMFVGCTGAGTETTDPSTSTTSMTEGGSMGTGGETTGPVAPDECTVEARGCLHDDDCTSCPSCEEGSPRADLCGLVGPGCSDVHKACLDAGDPQLNLAACGACLDACESDSETEQWNDCLGAMVESSEYEWFSPDTYDCPAHYEACLLGSGAECEMCIETCYAVDAVQCWCDNSFGCSCSKDACAYANKSNSAISAEAACSACMQQCGDNPDDSEDLAYCQSVLDGL